MDHFSQRIAQAIDADMRAAGMSQRGLAAAANIPVTTLVRRLAGAPFTTDELAHLAEALGRRVSDWVDPAEQQAS